MILPPQKTFRVQIISPNALIAAALNSLIDRANGRFETQLPVANSEKLARILEKNTADIALIDLESMSDVGSITRAVKDSDLRVLVLTSLTNADVADLAIAAGAMGVVRKSDQPEILFKALECVARGELWLDRVSTGRIFAKLARKNTASVSDFVKNHTESSPINSLTRKELLIASTIGQYPAATGQKLADLLHISENTLRNHLSTIYRKLDIRNRMELYTFAQENNITALPAGIKTSISQHS